jgi:hypothetical protein
MNRTVLLLLFLSLPSALRAQVVETPTGTVEFIGLESWTVEMVRDSMDVHAPGEPLGQCAAVLRSLGFVSASARVVTEQGVEPRTIVTVVEPWRADRIRLRVVRGDSAIAFAGRDQGRRLVTDAVGAFQTAIQLRGIARSADAETLAQLRTVFADRIEEMETVWSFLDRHSRPADLERALHTLGTVLDRTDAMLAAAILTGFPDEERAWWALLDAQRDEREMVAMTASQALAGLLSAEAPPVDWSPAAGSIRAILEGTNVAVLEGTLEALAATEVSSDLAAELLAGGGGDLVLARLAASHDRTRHAAHRFLVQLRGRDLGQDTAAWTEWIRGL